MTQISTAGRLLADLHKESPTLYENVAEQAGIVADRADATRLGELKLSLSEQLRLSEATMSYAKKFSHLAHDLRDQALDARRR